MARILITSGPTREYLDPVRFLSNGSSGKLGAALAAAALAAGHDVVVISGPVSIEYPARAQVVGVVTTEEMLAEAQRHFPNCDGAIGVAAPCDYRPRRQEPKKIRKSGEGLVLVLDETPDVIGTLGAMKRLNERTDKEKVETAVGAFRAGGLGVVGPEGTFDALIKGQVDELLVSANVRGMHGSSASRVLAAANDAGLLTEPAVDTTSAGEAAENDPQVIRLIDELITKATQTGAVITFIEDASLLSRYGGVAALLRFRI